jgi:hypothetical protein
VSMIAKITAFKLALFSATLSVLFAYWHRYVCLVAAILLLLIFNGIWAAKVARDQRLSKLHNPVQPTPPILKTSHGSNQLIVPQSTY